MTTCPVCDTPIEATMGRPRSYEQHKRYFALIRQAFFHWPETHPWQFANEAELRAWLQIKAGWRELASRTPVIGMRPEAARTVAEAAIRAAGAYAVPVVQGSDLVIWKPKSISYRSLPHLEACRLFDAVAVVIEQEAGLSAEQLLVGSRHDGNEARLQQSAEPTVSTSKATVSRAISRADGDHDSSVHARPIDYSEGSDRSHAIQS